MSKVAYLVNVNKNKDTKVIGTCNSRKAYDAILNDLQEAGYLYSGTHEENELYTKEAVLVNELSELVTLGYSVIRIG